MIAVISDVHGNLPALQAVLAEIDAQGLQRVWCLGDTVGYGPFVNECVRLVAQRCEVMLAGNHDLAVRGDVDRGVFSGSAGAGIDYARRVIADDAMQVLRSLSPHRVVGTVELYHASARDPAWEYVIDPQVAAQHLATQRAPLSLVGHSHRQLAYSIESHAEPGTPATGGPVEAGTRFELDTALKVVANPGSVGQPRDGDPRAAFVVVDGVSVTFHRVDYDRAPMRKAVQQTGLPTSIAECLGQGRAPR